MIVISLCLMIWNRNDCEWWNEHLERMAHVSATMKDLGKKILNINTWIDWILLSNIVINLNEIMEVKMILECV
jgi:hypothetical protein